MLIVSALAIFFTWVVMAVALIGVSSIFRGLLNRECFFADAFWMGLCVSVGVLEIWNLFLPITSSATVLLLCAGLFGTPCKSIAPPRQRKGPLATLRLVGSVRCFDGSVHRISSVGPL
jgi:hypothetical protein